MKIREKFSVISLILGTGALLFSLQANAEDPEKMPHMPPKVAIDACQSKAENDTCSFVGHEGSTLSGSCFKGPKGILACAPKPPKEAIEACNGKTEEAACSFMGLNHDALEGVCKKWPAGGELTCKPNLPKIDIPKDKNGEPE